MDFGSPRDFGESCFGFRGPSIEVGRSPYALKGGPPWISGSLPGLEGLTLGFRRSPLDLVVSLNLEILFDLVDFTRF